MDFLDWPSTISYQNCFWGCNSWNGEGLLLGWWISSQVGWHACTCWNFGGVPYQRNHGGPVGAQGGKSVPFVTCFYEMFCLWWFFLLNLLFFFWVQFPFFCSDREYIIGRRIWESGRLYYCVTKVWERLDEWVVYSIFPFIVLVERQLDYIHLLSNVYHETRGLWVPFRGDPMMLNYQSYVELLGCHMNIKLDYLVLEVWYSRYSWFWILKDMPGAAVVGY
jgi:hypothetical protein